MSNFLSLKPVWFKKNFGKKKKKNIVITTIYQTISLDHILKRNSSQIKIFISI